MAIVMLAILMIHLQTFSRLALVFVTAPLGLIGATGVRRTACSTVGITSR
jgi:multidrug efflux pump